MEEIIKDKPRSSQNGPRVNQQIRLHECRLIGDDGEQYGVVSMPEAIKIAQDLGLDLVEISPSAKPPVVKVIDYGKFKYEQQKKANESKKKQAQVDLKEIQFRPNIETHDLNTKLKHAEKFLHQGDKVKLVMTFRGREMAYKDAGLEKFKGIINTLIPLGGLIESEAKFMGNRVIAILAPDKATIQKLEKMREKDSNGQLEA